MTGEADLEALGIDAAGRARLGELLAKDWSLPGGHPLSRLHNQPLGPYRLAVLLGPKNHVGSQYFQMFLVSGSGTLADEPLAQGLHNSGPYPGFNWVELTRYNSRLTADGAEIDLRDGDLDLELFGMLSELVPAGGHLMVEYDSPSQRETARALTRGVPAAATETGYRLFQVGCLSFRDWYIPEGGREGPRKLQGFKPYSEEIRREKTGALREELEAFLSASHQVSADETGRRAMERAKRALSGL